MAKRHDAGLLAAPRMLRKDPSCGFVCPTQEVAWKLVRRNALDGIWVAPVVK
jgi:hypothetical protein